MWLALVGGIGLSLLLLPLIVGHTTPILAASSVGSQSASSPLDLCPLSRNAQVTCTLAITTTTSLPGINSFATAAILADYSGLALAVGDRNASVPPEENYFRLDNAIPGHSYTVEAIPDGLGNYNLGLVVYNASYTPILTDSNTLDGNDAAVTLIAPNTGPYYFKVFQISNYCSGGTYHLSAYGLPPTSTPTRTPGPTATTQPEPTAIPGADRFEPNYDFNKAATIATDVTYDDLNFIPWGSSSEDNDYYKIWVKPGLFFTCQTTNLGPGVDTNMIFYDHNRNLIAGNDDVALGDYSSYVSYYSTYEGWLYILVGHGGRLPLADVSQSTYSLRCTKTLPGTPTPYAKLLPTATPYPQDTSSVSPLPTPIPTVDSAELVVRTLTTPVPPSPADTSAPRFVPIDLLVYYDSNDDRSPGAGEGIAGVVALAYDTATGEQIAQGITDPSGRLRFTAAARGAVRISIPYLGVSQTVGSAGASIYVRIAPQSLPTTIP